MQLSQAPSFEVDPTKPAPAWAGWLEKGLTIWQAREVSNINKKRLAQGLPPLSEREMRSLAPAANVKVELPSEVKTAIFAGFAVLAFWLLSRD